MSDEDLKSVFDDAKAIRLTEEFVKISQKEGSDELANCLLQLIETIASFGLSALQPNKPIQTEILKSIESTKYYYLSTVKISNNKFSKEQFETALFASDQEGVVQCWNPVLMKSTQTVHEAQEERNRIKIKAESGNFDRVNPWAT